MADMPQYTKYKHSINARKIKRDEQKKNIQTHWFKLFCSYLTFLLCLFFPLGGWSTFFIQSIIIIFTYIRFLKRKHELFSFFWISLFISQTFGDEMIIISYSFMLRHIIFGTNHFYYYVYKKISDMFRSSSSSSVSQYHSKYQLRQK